MNAPAPPLPAFATIEDWCILSGMSRRGTFRALQRRHLVGRKMGRSTMIDVPRGMAWINSLPTAQEQPSTVPSRAKTRPGVPAE